jgi:hypothetical protein
MTSIHRKQFTWYKGGDSNKKFKVSWNDIFYWISPSMIDELSEIEFKKSLDRFVFLKTNDDLKKEETFSDGGNFYAYELVQDDFQTIKVQFRALGLITKSNKSRSIKDNGTYWSLTPYGDEIMTRLRAIQI